MGSEMCIRDSLYDTDDPDAEAAVAKDEPGEKIFTDDYDDLA